MGAPNAIVPSSNDPIGGTSMAGELSFFDDGNDLFDLDSLLGEPLVRGVMDECNGNVAGNSEAGPSGVHVEENIHENEYFNDGPQGSILGNPMQISGWPVLPSPYCCTCCQTLREFFHIKGALVNKLEIHGRLGIISHAVLDRYNSEFSPLNHKYHMFDFCNESISSVKQFLVQYCGDCKKQGYIMLQDPLSNFYDALCTGLGDNGNLDDDIFRQQTQTGKSQRKQQRGENQQEGERIGTRQSKSHIAAQRERTGKMRAKDLMGYFHLPITAAAKEINICPTAMKKICRKGGVSRWPHRKIKSIQRQIAERSKSLNSNDAEEKARALAEIKTLEQTLASICLAHHE